MTTSSRKSYNIEALRGGDLDDMELIEQYGLDPALAYTPEINAAAAEAQMKDSIADGMDPAEAKKIMDIHIRGAKRLM